MTESIAPALIPDSHAHVVHSTAVGDDYQLSVWMPPSYESSSAAYPVIYVLDAGMTFGFAAQATMISIFGGLLPEVLVVGIGRPSRSAYEPGPSRARDFSPVPLPGDDESGHADAFAEALRSELLPFIENRYRTDTGDRTLWGHSMAGAFALFMLLEGPEFFRRIIATSPAVVEQETALLNLKGWPEPEAAFNATVFTSVGSADPDYLPHVESFNAQVRGRGYRGLRLESEILPDLGHIAAAPAGYLAGLRSVFNA